MKLAQLVRDFGRPLSAPLSGFPGIALTNTSVAQNLRDGNLQARTIKTLNRVVGFDIIFPMMDLTVEAEALGAQVDWEMDELPAVTGKTVETLEDAEAITVPEIGAGNRLDVFVTTCRALKQAFPEKLVWAYALGPFSIAARLMGMTEIALATKIEPEVATATLRKANELLKRYIGALLDTGVDGVMILEPASSILRADDADTFSNTYIRELVELIKARGKTPALHNCGQINHMVEGLCATGIEALSVGSCVDPLEIYRVMPEDTVLMGNLDPTEVFLRSSSEEVRLAARRLSDRMADCERFVISSGCDLPPGVTIENLLAFELATEPEEAVLV